MPLKKKGGKKGGDDWESELGEPIEVTNNKAAADPTPADDGDSTGGGGLLAAARKNKSKRAKKGKDVNDFVQGEEAQDGAEDAAGDSLAEKAPEEATADDLFAQPISKAKSGKGKVAAKPVPASDEEGSVADSVGGALKSKKEKEKEKKEREKQRKKEAAAKKKTPAPPPASTVTPEQSANASSEPTTAAPPLKADAGKKKKVPAGIAALQKQMEERRQREAEIARKAEEEKTQRAEQERLEAEKEQKDAESKARRKEREREKKEEMRKAGTLLSKAQKEAKAHAERRKEQMLAAGAKVLGLEEGRGEKKKPVYEKRKKGGKSKVDEEATLQEAQRKAELENERLAEERERQRKEVEEQDEKGRAASALTQSEEPSEPEDWETAAAADDDVKESWDADSEEEKEKKEKAKMEAAKAQRADETIQRANGIRNALATRVKANGDSKGARDTSDSSDETDSDEEKSSNQKAVEKRKALAATRRQQQREEALAARSKDNLRSPICCILGHVDTGKTKLLDKIRQTNVQEGEAGGITQQIGATYFPAEALRTKTAVVNKDGKFEFKVPGLLVIDTPGHESFTNLRSRGSSLCNIAILVVDIMHGLEPQTLESMRLLRDRKTPFIVALNKIDRLYGWKKIENNGFQDSLALQSKGVQNEFRDRLEKTKIAFAEQGFNSELYYENKSMARNVSLVPTSAHTGEGIPDMIKLLVALTQERMTNSLMYLSEVECTVLEVKVIEGLGTTIDVVISNGVLREGDRIVLCGLNGAIATNIRALLTPAPLKELRVKSQYVHNETVKAALGVKIAANDLEHAIAGSRLLVVGPDDDEEDLEEEVMSDIENLLSRVSRTGRGVSVQASTLGSLEALLEFLKVSKIPVANISIGPVYKRDVMQAGIMLEKAKEYAVMLCFDVKVDKDAAAYAEEIGVKIFTADIIYHLFDDFTKHMAQLAEQRKEDSKLLAVFPCVLNPVAVFNKKDPIVVGVDVVEGNLKLLTPIAAVKTNPITGVKEVIGLGRVQSIERDHKQMQVCKKGQPSVAVKIEGPNQPGYGRQLEDKDTLYSLISRASIDTLKEFYRSDVSNEEWLLIKKLKGLFDIP